MEKPACTGFEYREFGAASQSLPPNVSFLKGFPEMPSCIFVSPYGNMYIKGKGQLSLLILLCISADDQKQLPLWRMRHLRPFTATLAMQSASKMHAHCHHLGQV